MKRRDLVKMLEQSGYNKVREGSEHDIYRNPQTKNQVAVPRHRDINENTAKAILREAGLR